MLANWQTSNWEQAKLSYQTTNIYLFIYYEIVHSGTLHKKDKNMIKKAQASPLKHVHLGLRRPVDIGTAALSRRHTALNFAFRILPTVTH